MIFLAAAFSGVVLAQIIFYASQLVTAMMKKEPIGFYTLKLFLVSPCFMVLIIAIMTRVVLLYY